MISGKIMGLRCREAMKHPGGKPPPSPVLIGLILDNDFQANPDKNVIIL